MTDMLERSEVERFRSLVARHLGLRFEDDKLDYLADALRQRMSDFQCDCPSYFHRTASFASATEEMRALAKQLTVNETYFFRYADHFRAFAEEVLPNRIQARRHRRQIRILSAGCASGEEAYSLAILIRERFPELASWDITIRGIDVNPAIVARALRARYSTWSLRETPMDLRAKYFRAEGRDFLLDDAIKSAVAFEERNVVTEDPGFWQRDAFDIVFCRNVTMYFTAEATRSVMMRIAQSLTPGGFLFLGHAETLRGISQDFHLRHTHETFYYQRREIDEALCDFIVPRSFPGNGTRVSSPVPTVLDPDDSWFDIIHRASERITQLTEEKNRQGPGTFDKTTTKSTSLLSTQPKQTSVARTPAPTTVRDRTVAMELMRQERFAEAIDLLRELPQEAKVDPDTQLLLAALLTNRGELTEAEKVCEQLLKLDELNAGARYLMALCQEHAGSRDAAMEQDHAAIYLDPAFAMPHLHLGLMAKRFADMELARRELGQALVLLALEDASRVFLFGGGFSREALMEFCRAEIRASGGAA